MRQDVFLKIEEQLKKYNLCDFFNGDGELRDGVSDFFLGFSNKQINNFINLSVDSEEIKFPSNLLLNFDLLNCDDYNDRVFSMSKIKNGDGCWHLFSNLCSKNFLNSDNYYEDMKFISKASNIRYLLWIVNDKNFINSKYHNEDLSLITSFSDDCLVSSALATVANNKHSINSFYHQEDMKLISTADRSSLQFTCSYPCYGLNNLAINNVSLNDKYHSDNMKILANKTHSKRYLYNIMTDKKKITDDNYRMEVDVLSKAKSEITARALYYYIANPDRQEMNRNFNHELCRELMEYYDNNLFDVDRMLSYDLGEHVPGTYCKDYDKYLRLLSKVDDKYVMFFELVLSNKKVIDSGYLDYCLNLLLNASDECKFIDLYKVISSDVLLSSDYYINDINIINSVDDAKKRELLTFVATRDSFVNNSNHLLDMKFISENDLDSGYIYYSFLEQEEFEMLNEEKSLNNESIDCINEGRKVKIFKRIRNVFKVNN